MATIQEKINAKLELQKNALMRIGEEYCESGNQYVVSAGVWLRPVITDFIAIVRDRHQTIVDNAEKNQLFDPDVVKAADAFYDEVVAAILPVFPLPVRGQVRGITSQIKNDLAITRIISEERIHELHPDVLPPRESTWRNHVAEIGSNPEKFKTFCEDNLLARDGICGIIFGTQFYNLVTQCINGRVRNTTKKKSATKNEVDNPNYKTRAYKTNFDAFRHYWKSLPHGNLLLAVAIKKLIEDGELLQKIICYKTDVKELFLVYLPTIELREIALENILRIDYLPVRTVTQIYNYLPEGKSVNWRVEFARFGIHNYQTMPHANDPVADWETSPQKNRAQTYATLLQDYKDAAPLIKKIIVYALLESRGKKLQQQVYKVMGYASLESARKSFRDSIKADTQHLNIDFNQLVDTVILQLVKKTSSKATLASGAYAGILAQLKRLLPAMLSMRRF